MADSAAATTNVNVGILGHVDSGKTSLARVLSTTFSTAALDKNPQSRERGITLDLGFSSLVVDAPQRFQDAIPGCEQLQLTLVDCPGHASLIRTIIGGAQIIDMMILVIDVKKGIQTQTAECLVIGEVLMNNLVVVLNKVDQFPEETRDAQVKKVADRLRQALASTKFRDAPMIPVAADAGASGLASDSAVVQSIGIRELVDALVTAAPIPKRDAGASFFFAVDHCFPIKGQGTVLTGTVLSGAVSVGQTVELPESRLQRKVKSMQMFRRPVERAIQGDRVALCVTQFDAKLMERGIVSAVGAVPTLQAALVDVHPVRFFKYNCPSKSKLHVTVGHETVMATVTFFRSCDGSKTPDVSQKAEFNWGAEYEYALALKESDGEGGAAAASSEKTDRAIWALMEFDHPIACPVGSVYIASRLDVDASANMCRIAFYGRLAHVPAKTDLANLKVFQMKERRGGILRVVDDQNLIIKDMFRKETDLSKFLRLTISLEPSGKRGTLESSFGASGAVKAWFAEGHGLPISVKKSRGGKGAAAAAEAEEETEGGGGDSAVAGKGSAQSVVLRFKKYKFGGGAGAGGKQQKQLAQ